MDTESVNQGGLSFWENVRKLVYIYFLQQRKGIMAFVCGMLLASLYVFVLNILRLRSMLSAEALQSQWIVAGYGGLIHCGMFILLFASCNMLVDKKISMFPGNVWSRYIARQILDHSLFLGYVLLFGMLYLLHSALFWLFLHQNPVMDFRYLIDVRYLGLGMLQLYLLWMLWRGILAIPLAIHAKWGNQVLIGTALVFILLFICLSTFFPKVRTQIFTWRFAYAYVMESGNFFRYAGFALLIWLIGNLLSGLLISRMRKWRNSNGTVPLWIGFFCWTCWSIIMGLQYGTVTVDTTERMDSYETSEKQDDAGMYYLTKQILVEAETITADFSEENPIRYDCVNDSDGKKLATMGDYIGLECDYVITSVSRARQDGMPEEVDLSGVDGEHILYYFQVPDVQFHGQHIYRKWIEDLEEHLIPATDAKSFRMEYRKELKSNLRNDFFPNADRFLYPDSQITMHDWYMNAPYYGQIIAVLDEENYERVTEE